MTRCASSLQPTRPNWLGCLPGLKTRSLPGSLRPGFSPTSAAPVSSPRLRCGQAGIPRLVHWRGSESTTAVTDSTTRREHFLTASRLRWHNSTPRTAVLTGIATKPTCKPASASVVTEYAQRISLIHEWIRAGDVYQLNYTMPYTVRVRGSIAGFVRAAGRAPAGGLRRIPAWAGGAADSLVFTGAVLSCGAGRRQPAHRHTADEGHCSPRAYDARRPRACRVAAATTPRIAARM